MIWMLARIKVKNNKIENLLNELKSQSSLIDDMDSNFSNDTPEKNIKNYVSNNFKHEHYEPKFNIIWSENKETLLFSLLISVVVIIIGLISNYIYITFAGILSFLLFSILVFITFFNYVLVSKQKSQIPSDIISKINTIENKLDFLYKKGGTTSFSSNEKYLELEERVEELKNVVKTILENVRGK